MAWDGAGPDSKCDFESVIDKKLADPRWMRARTSLGSCRLAPVCSLVIFTRPRLSPRLSTGELQLRGPTGLHNFLYSTHYLDPKGMNLSAATASLKSGAPALSLLSYHCADGNFPTAGRGDGCCLEAVNSKLICIENRNIEL